MKKLKNILFFLFLGQFSVPLFGQQRPPIIDMHMHIGAPLDLPAGAPAPCLPQPCERKGKATANSAENLKKTLEMMDRYNIILGFLSHFEPKELQDGVKQPQGALSYPLLLMNRGSPP
jgi:uncharacterized protein